MGIPQLQNQPLTRSDRPALFSPLDNREDSDGQGAPRRSVSLAVDHMSSAEPYRRRPYEAISTRKDRSPDESHVEATRGILSSVALGGLMWAFIGLTVFVAI